MTHFTRLGLPRRFVLEAGEIERQYLARSRAVHPDYHAAGSSADLAASLDVSAALNEAYATLRDPFTRAEYLLKLEGGPSAAEHKQMAPAFLTEMLEAREKLEEVRSAQTPCSSAVVELAEEFGTRYDGLLAAVGKSFAELESLPPDDSRRLAVRTGIRANLNAAKYVRAEDKSEKHPVTPGPLAPAREQYAQMLFERGQTKEALAAFEATLKKEPNRLLAYAGAARAAAKGGDAAKARGYYTKIVELASGADTVRAEVAEARAFVAKKG